MLLVMFSPSLFTADTIGLLRAQILERWVSKVVQERELTVSDLFDDLKDGFVLYNLCEVSGP